MFQRGYFQPSFKHSIICLINSWINHWKTRSKCSKGIDEINKRRNKTTCFDNDDLFKKVREETGVKAAVSRAVPDVNERILSVTGTPQQVGDAFSMKHCSFFKNNF